MSTMKENRKQLAKIRKELDEAYYQSSVIKATYTHKIYSDLSYNSIDYNGRNDLRRTDVTIQLYHDLEYQQLRRRINDLTEQDRLLCDEDEYGIQYYSQ